jgi:hypothetical protein
MNSKLLEDVRNLQAQLEAMETAQQHDADIGDVSDKEE